MEFKSNSYIIRFMIDKNKHFRISKHKDYLYVIKENISLVHPFYTNDPLNIYLFLGAHTALLLDTGCGLHPIKPLIDKLIERRRLLVFNTHYHWDHPLGNVEFEEVYIHEDEVDLISKPYDVSFFKDSPNKIIEIYAKQNFLIPPAKIIKPLKDGDIFDLGGIEVKVIHCPGHSPGSICLLTSAGELFTSDVAYYGDQFLPKKENLSEVLQTLSKLISIYEEYKDKNQKNLELYPSHRKYPCDKKLLTDLYDGIKNIENLWDTKKEFEFFDAWQIDDPNSKFRYFVSRS
ncbi:MAG: MBL fold metallo-hydrolase [Promethearchaeota archaeon]